MINKNQWLTKMKDEIAGVATKEFVRLKSKFVCKKITAFFNTMILFKLTD